MAEDLGSININVRDLGGGGGGGSGGGNVGGGPAPRTPQANPNARIGANLNAYPSGIGPYTQMQIANTAVFGRQFAMLFERMANDWRRNVELWRQQTIRGLGGNRNIQSAIPGATSMIGELQQFISRPGLMSAAQLASANSATSGFLKGLGVSAAGLAPALLAFGAGIGLAVGAVALLRSAMQRTSERIEATWRYSGILMGAKIQDDLSKMISTMREAQANGALYASSLRAQTQAEVAWAESMIGFNRAAAIGGTLYSDMSRQVSYLFRPFSFALGKVAESSQSTLEFIGQTFLSGIFGPQQMYLSKIYSTVDDIRRAQASGVLNQQWFKDDIRSMTGKEYGDI